MFTYGTTIEQLAEVAVSARFNATDNPEAYYREPITIDDVLGGPMIADPFTKLHCCIRSDGGARQCSSVPNVRRIYVVSQCGCWVQRKRPRTC